VLFFDVMDTLVVDPFYTVLPQFFGMSFNELLAAKHPTSWVDFELGLLEEKQFLDSFFSDGRPVDGPGLRAALRDAYCWVDGMQPVVEALQEEGHELHCFSNYPQWHTIIEDKCGLSKCGLQWTAVSCLPHMKARKPDAAAYAAAAKAAGALDDDILILVDDRRQNIDAARACGWDGVHFSNAAALVEELRARGLRGI
jgi:FMN hydrolase / 5-amino-6-(5-phospho-D-ribitylamino)uracil phosphatase